jgi:hypothetical protein
MIERLIVFFNFKDIPGSESIQTACFRTSTLSFSQYVEKSRLRSASIMIAASPPIE